MRPIAAFLAILTAFVAGSAGAAEIRVDPDPRGGIVLAISGRIDDGDGRRVQDILGREFRPDRPVTVVLNSPGGSLTDGMWIARTIAKARAVSTVPPGGMCASVCFLGWAAGSERRAGPGARIGVHTAAEGVTETDTARAYTLDMARSAGFYGAPATVVAAMVTTRNGAMYWLDSAEIAAMTKPRP